MVQAPSEFDLADALDRLKAAIDKDLEKGPKPNEFISVFQKISGTETDRKSASDQTLKLILQQKLSDNKPASEIVIVLQYGTSAARKALCNILTPFNLISDALDCSTITNCVTIFDFIEKHTAIWKSSQFYTQGKNNLLRACNDLLRRLSQSQLYTSIWGVQDFFRSPLGMYEPEKFKIFEESVNKIIETFKNYKLENNETARTEEIEASSGTDQSKHVYFPKFLTSSSLTELQLSDPSFRRQVLTQILFLFQYLNGYVKFRPATNVLPYAQREWVKLKEKEVFALLNETPPNGQKYTKFIKHLIERENFWVKWKNEGCQKFMKEKEPEVDSGPAAKKRRTLYDDIMGNRKLGLGSAELTKLWGKSESNLEACKTPKRQFIPQVEAYFEEAIMQSDPKNEIEDKYKCYLDPSYGWRSLRLLAHSSPLFFSLQPATMHHLPVPKYLEHIFKRLRKEQAETTKTDKIEDDTESKAVDAAADDDNEFENEKEEEAPPTPVKDEKTGLLTNEEVDQLAKALGNKWEELAEELRHITQKDIKMFKEDADDDELRARIALVAWQDKNGAEATKTTMIETLTAIGMEEMATSVFGSDKMEE